MTRRSHKQDTCLRISPRLDAKRPLNNTNESSDPPYKGNFGLGYQSKSIANVPTTPSTPPRTSAPKRVMQGSRATSRCCVDARVQLPSHPAARRRSGPTWGAIRHLGGVILAGGTRKVNAMTWCFTCLDDRRILTGDHKTGIARLECGHYTTHHDNDRGD